MLVIDLGLALMSLSIIRKNNMKVDVIWGKEVFYIIYVILLSKRVR